MDGIIFDVDGTLWDSVEVVAESWNLAIKENSDLEPNLNREILQGLFGKTMDEIAAGQQRCLLQPFLFRHLLPEDTLEFRTEVFL